MRRCATSAENARADWAVRRWAGLRLSPGRERAELADAVVMGRPYLGGATPQCCRTLAVHRVGPPGRFPLGAGSWELGQLRDGRDRAAFVGPNRQALIDSCRT